MQFTLNDTWHNGYDVPTHLDLFRGPWQLTFFSGLSGSPEDVLSRLRALSSIVPGPVFKSTVGELPGSAFEATPRLGRAKFEELNLYELRPGGRLQVRAFEVGGQTVLVLIQASERDFAEFQDVVEQVLQTVRFTD